MGATQDSKAGKAAVLAIELEAVGVALPVTCDMMDRLVASKLVDDKTAYLRCAYNLGSSTT